MSTWQTAEWAAYLLATVAFVAGLHLMNAPSTARHGNLVSAGGMLLAVTVTVVHLGRAATITTTGVVVLVAGALTGAAVGLYTARHVPMTAMPQLVSVFNAVGGGAAAMVAVNELAAHGTTLAASAAGAGAIDVLIGTLTFSGSLIAAGKLQGLVPGGPVAVPGRRIPVAATAVCAVAAGGWLVTAPAATAPLVVLAVAALVLGVLVVLPIGGADMPVVISMLNALTGTAVAMAGFVLNSLPLIVAGALVGASGAILTRLMAVAMHRSVAAILAGGYGSDGSGDQAPVGGPVRQVGADDVALQLAYAGSVVIVPGYGLAAAQAQRQAAELGELLRQRGTAVSYAVHPVAGRMPGHMNVLLAEADVPYPQMRELQDGNADLGHADVALVVGANDVTNPAARLPGNAVSGMPILDVDSARSVVVVKRSMGHGYAGIDNPLYHDPRTGMLFADAKQGLTDIIASVRSLVG